MQRIITAAALAFVLSVSAADAYPRFPWCGWYMMRVFGETNKALYRAINWARWGRPAPGPVVGAVVVWPRHVGKIVGPCTGKICVVHSGNDGHAVRTRARSVAGAVAFRYPS